MGFSALSPPSSPLHGLVGFKRYCPYTFMIWAPPTMLTPVFLLAPALVLSKADVILGGI